VLGSTVAVAALMRRHTKSPARRRCCCR
jgi:hypothetical protein